MWPPHRKSNRDRGPQGGLDRGWGGWARLAYDLCSAGSVFASSDRAEGPLLTADSLLELWGPQ